MMEPRERTVGSPRGRGLGLTLLGFVSILALACAEDKPPAGDLGTGGAGGNGDAGAGGSVVCVPGTTEPCYGGPSGTADVGLCKSGSHTCLPSGLSFDVCEGEVFPSPEDCLTPEDEACDGSGPSECPHLGLGWVKSFGLSGENEVRDVALDPQTGDLVVVGRLSGTADFGGGLLTSAGGDDLFVARFGPLGELRWSKRFGDASAQIANAVAIDASGRIFVGGEVSGSIDFGQGPYMSAGGTDALLFALDPMGEVVWAKLFGSGLDQKLEHVAVTNTGALVVGGSYRNAISLGGPVLVSPNLDDIFVGVLDASGAHVVSKSFGGINIDSLQGLDVDSEGSIFVTGTFAHDIDFGPAAGGVLETASYDVFVAKLSAGGVGIWAKQIGNLYMQRGFALAVGPSGDVFVAGETVGPIDIDTVHLDSPTTARALYLARFEPGGAVAWGKLFGGPKTQLLGASLDVDVVTGDLVAAGYFDDVIDLGAGPQKSAGGTDILLARLSKNGDPLTSRIIGGPSSEGALSVLVSPKGEPVLGGAYYGAIDFGGGPLPAPNQLESRSFVARLLP